MNSFIKVKDFGILSIPTMLNKTKTNVFYFVNEHVTLVESHAFILCFARQQKTCQSVCLSKQETSRRDWRFLGNPTLCSVWVIFHCAAVRQLWHEVAKRHKPWASRRSLSLVLSLSLSFSLSPPPHPWSSWRRKQFIATSSQRESFIGWPSPPQLSKGGGRHQLSMSALGETSSTRSDWKANKNMNDTLK